MKKTTRNYITVSGALVASLALALTAFAGTWSAPTGNPPGNNVDAPINIGTTVQSKSGALGVTGLANFGVSTLLSKVTIGCVPTNMTGCIGAFGPLLEVGYGTSRFDYDVTMNGKLLFPNNGSKVGIGLTYPDRQLHVHSTNSQAGVTISTGTSNWMSLYQPYNVGDLRIRQGTVASGNDLATFKATGNVGIATTDPQAKLDVNGGIKAQSIQLTTSPSDKSILISDANGNAKWSTGGGGALYMIDTDGCKNLINPSVPGSKSNQVSAGGIFDNLAMPGTLTTYASCISYGSGSTSTTYQNKLIMYLK